MNLLVDDHIVVRVGVRRLLEMWLSTDIRETATSDETLAAYRAQRPEVVLLDINLGRASGLDILTRLLAEDERARVIVFSMHADPLYVSRALNLGARGYVSKSAPAEELCIAVTRVAEGGRYIEREIATQLAFAMEDGKHPLQKLSPRETEIMRLLGEGNSLLEIANAMGVAYKTVANTCSVIKTKLGVLRTAELIRIAIGIK